MTSSWRTSRLMHHTMRQLVQCVNWETAPTNSHTMTPLKEEVT